MGGSSGVAHESSPDRLGEGGTFEETGGGGPTSAAGASHRRTEENAEYVGGGGCDCQITTNSSSTKAFGLLVLFGTTIDNGATKASSSGIAASKQRYRAAIRRVRYRPLLAIADSGVSAAFCANGAYGVALTPHTRQLNPMAQRNVLYDYEASRVSIRAKALLSTFAERVWAWRRSAGAPFPILLPGTGAELIFFIGEPPSLVGLNGERRKLPSACVMSLRSQSAVIEAKASTKFVSVRIRTGMLGPLLGRNPSEFHDTCAPVEALLGEGCIELTERIQSLCLEDALAAVYDYTQTLATFARRPEPFVEEAMRQLYYASSLTRIDALSVELGITRRHLERRFLATTGLGPKHYQRIARVHHTVRHLLLSRESDYLATAVAYGFCDQAHFIHELRALTGLRPSAILTDCQFRSHFYNPPSVPAAILVTHEEPRRSVGHHCGDSPSETRLRTRCRGGTAGARGRNE